MNIRRLTGAISRRAKEAEIRTHYLISSMLSQEAREKYIYVSHHKCATQYTISIMRDVCALKHIPAHKYDWRQKISAGSLMLNSCLLIQDYSRDIIDFDKVAGRGFHVIRDPRDILVSLYFSHRDSHVVRDPKASEILRDRKVLNEIDTEEGLKFLLNESHYWKRVIGEIEAWNYHSDKFYETRFEKLVANPFDEFCRILNFIGLEVEPAQLQMILDKNSFGALKNKTSAVQPAAPTVHYRKGKSGDWRNYLIGEVNEIFKLRYGNLLVRLGYEEGYDW